MGISQRGPTVATAVIAASAAPFHAMRRMTGNTWLIVTCGAIGCAFAAAALYVFSVNAMLLDGAAIQRTERQLEALEREATALRESSVRQSSPAWLVRQADVHGMVAIGEVRYLTPEEAMALRR